MSSPLSILPEDSFNRDLVANVHPPDWRNPTPATRYNLVVIGAGTAGLVSAAGAAGLGAKVALVEKGLMGGDCLNVGCVPSKALIRSSRTRTDVEHCDRFGIYSRNGAHVDFPGVMERMRRLRSHLSRHDSAHRFSELGVDVFLGAGTFKGRNVVEVAGSELRFSKAVVATGARPAVPPIPGLETGTYLTNETVFALTKAPSRLLIIGAGPIGCELAQAFQRLGSAVTLVEARNQLLLREESDAANVLEKSMRRDGVDIRLGTRVIGVSDRTVHLQQEDRHEVLETDLILVAVGRIPNVEGLRLERAGIEYDPQLGIHVNDRLQTTNPKVFAAGDIALKHKFTHTADAAARIVIRNALFWGKKKVSALTVPWCTYTSPEIAHVGMYERDARAKGLAVDIFKVALADVDRAVLDGEDDGFVKVLVKQGTDRILGATIVAEHAGEMISELTLAMVSGTGLGPISNVIHPYPTRAEAIRKVADAYNRTRLTPLARKAFRRWFSWQRR